MQKLIVNKIEFKMRFLRKINHIDAKLYLNSTLIASKQFEATTDKKNIILFFRDVAKEHIKTLPYYLQPDRKQTEKNLDTLHPVSFFVRNGNPNDTFITPETQARCHAYASYYGVKIKTKILSIENQPHTKITIK